MTTAITQTQPPPVEKILDSVFQSHGFQQEEMTQEYLRIRRKNLKENEEFQKEEAEFDVRQFLSTDEARRKAAMKLASDATSPVVSRETQTAVLKQLIQDYFRGKKRPGLGAVSVLKAIELINKMTGYDAPIKQEIEHNHKINVLPIIAEPFKGELEPLKVADVHDDNVVEVVALPADQQDKELTPEDF